MLLRYIFNIQPFHWSVVIFIYRLMKVIILACRQQTVARFSQVIHIPGHYITIQGDLITYNTY